MTDFIAKSAKISLLALTAVSLAGCASTRPASVAGECSIIRDPGFAVQGKRRQDQQAIDANWLEPAYASCGWPRPKS